MRLNIKTEFLGLGILFISSLFFVLCCLPALGDSFFLIDDFDLTSLPLFRAPIDSYWLKTLFTPGWHVDYYPVRELSYWFDVYVLKASTQGENGLIFRIHNLLILLAQGLTIYFFLKDYTTKVIAGCWAALWVLNPIQLEHVLWISSRKDLLATFFAMIAAYAGSKWKLTQNRNYLFLLGFFVVMSLFSKATYAAMFAWLAVLGFVFFFRKKRRMETWFFFTLFCLNIFWILFQSRFYSKFNDMSANYTYDYRLWASAAALGRELTGWIWASANSVDVENWGAWAQNNSSYAWIGVSVWLILGGLCIYSLKKKNWIGLLLLTVLLTLYLPTSGIIFPHRNFYSVRYLSPVLWVLILFFAYIFRSARWTFPALMICLLHSAAGLYFESSHWFSPLKMTSKSLQLSPQSESLQWFHLQALSNEIRWGRLSSEDEVQFRKWLASTIDQCARARELSSNPNSHLCLNFWKNSKTLAWADSQIQLDMELSQEAYRKAITQLNRGSERVRQLLAQISLRPIDENLNLGVLQNELRENPATLNSVERRFEYWRFLCEGGHAETARNLMKTWMRELKMDAASVRESLGLMTEKFVFPFNECWQP